MISEYLEIKAQEQIMTTEKLNTNIHKQTQFEVRAIEPQKVRFCL